MAGWQSSQFYNCSEACDRFPFFHNVNVMVAMMEILVISQFSWTDFQFSYVIVSAATNFWSISSKSFQYFILRIIYVQSFFNRYQSSQPSSVVSLVLPNYHFDQDKSDREHNIIIIAARYRCTFMSKILWSLQVDSSRIWFGPNPAKLIIVFIIIISCKLFKKCVQNNMSKYIKICKNR